MSRSSAFSSRRVQPTRKTARADRPFGAGLLRFVPFAVLAPGFVEPAPADRAIVGQMFADDGPDFNALAAEAEWQRQYEEGLVPPPEIDRCLSCGELAYLASGLCPECL